jgi:hypothetical protein
MKMDSDLHASRQAITHKTRNVVQKLARSSFCTLRRAILWQRIIVGGISAVGESRILHDTPRPSR